MASPASLPQEVKPYVSVSPAGGASTQTATSPASSVGPTTSNSPCGYVNDSVQEPLQTKFGNAPSFTIPAPSFSYNVPHNANISFGTSHQLSPSSAIKSNPPAPQMSGCVGGRRFDGGSDNITVQPGLFFLGDEEQLTKFEFGVG
ncbi:hypothetical protein TB2_022310 [Malus domestica]